MGAVFKVTQIVQMDGICNLSSKALYVFFFQERGKGLLHPSAETILLEVHLQALLCNNKGLDCNNANASL